MKYYTKDIETDIELGFEANLSDQSTDLEWELMLDSRDWGVKSSETLIKRFIVYCTVQCTPLEFEGLKQLAYDIKTDIREVGYLDDFEQESDIEFSLIINWNSDTGFTNPFFKNWEVLNSFHINSGVILPEKTEINFIKKIIEVS